MEGEGKSMWREGEQEKGSKRDRGGQAAAFTVGRPTWPLPGNCGVEFTQDPNKWHTLLFCFVVVNSVVTSENTGSKLEMLPDTWPFHILSLWTY